jgi:hypothetical protein
MIFVFGSITMVVGQDTEDEMVVPMGIIVLEPPESVEPKRSSVEFPHSTHFASVDCGTCHHTWEGTEIIKGCATTDCHDVTVSPTKSGEGLEASFKELEETLTIPGPTSCIQCHPKEE